MIIQESPLQGMTIGNRGTVALRELPGLHTIDLRVRPGSRTQTLIAETLRIDLSAKPGKTDAKPAADGNKTYSLCLAPDWWLIIGYTDAEQRLAPLRMNDDYHFSAVDVSGQRTTIELEGPNARDVLAHLWEQDLREKHFPVGAVSQGLMAKAPVIVFHIASLRYHILVRSSFALHLWLALADAAEEWL